MAFLRDENNNPKIGIGIWADDADTEMAPSYLMFMSLTLEALNYYCDSTEEAKAIFDFIDRSFKCYKDPEYGKVYRFGETRIIFTDEEYGIGIVILQK